MYLRFVFLHIHGLLGWMALHKIPIPGLINIMCLYYVVAVHCIYPIMYIRALSTIHYRALMTLITI